LSEEIQVEHLQIELVTKIQWATGLKANQELLEIYKMKFIGFNQIMKELRQTFDRWQE